MAKSGRQFMQVFVMRRLKKLVRKSRNSIFRQLPPSNDYQAEVESQLTTKRESEELNIFPSKELNGLYPSFPTFIHCLKL